jgi:hypothetical protein
VAARPKGKILLRDPPVNDARFTVLGLLFDRCSGRDWRTCLGRQSAIDDFKGLGSRIRRHCRPRSAPLSKQLRGHFGRLREKECFGGIPRRLAAGGR